MSDCTNESGFKKFLSYLPIATLLALVIAVASFGRAWGEIRQEVTDNKQTIKTVQEERVEISGRLSKISTDIDWLVKSVDKMMSDKE